MIPWTPRRFEVFYPVAPLVVLVIGLAGDALSLGAILGLLASSCIGLCYVAAVPYLNAVEAGPEGGEPDE